MKEVFTYTEYYNDEPAKVQHRANGPESKDEVEIIVKITMDRKRYEMRKNKFKETLWQKAYKIFFNT